MIKLRLTVGPDVLEVEGDLTMAEVLSLVDHWFARLPVPLDEDTLRTLTAQLTQATTALATAVRADAGTLRIGVTDAETNS